MHTATTTPAPTALAPAPFAAGAPDRIDPVLVDALTGVVSRAWSERLPSFGPPGLRLWLAQLSRTDPFGSPLGSDTTAGCAWWDDDAARRAAIGEAVEWYSASLVPAGLVRRSAAALAPDARIDLADLTLYTSEQTAAPGFPFLPLTEDLPIRWATGRALGDDRLVHVPASVTYLGYGTGPTADEPLTNLPVNSGLAAHHDRGAAVAAALGEAVERDALAEAWTFDETLVPLVLPPWFATDLGADGETTWDFFRLPTRIDVSGILAVVRHETSRVTGVGAAVRPEPVAAARKAAAEAMLAASGAIEIDRAGSRQCARLMDDAGPLSPWRADRAYRQTYRPDWHDVVDIACHAQLYLDPVMQTALTDRLAELSRAAPSVPLEALPTVDGVDGFGTRLLDAGFEPVIVDITTSDVASLGWTVVRAVVPGLRATGPAAFPYLGETRRSRTHRGAPHLAPVPHV